jgi:hypothetical protein
MKCNPFRAELNAQTDLKVMIISVAALFILMATALVGFNPLNARSALTVVDGHYKTINIVHGLVCWIHA